jgi:hypothetical protein
MSGTQELNKCMITIVLSTDLYIEKLSKWCKLENGWSRCIES